MITKACELMAQRIPWFSFENSVQDIYCPVNDTSGYCSPEYLREATMHANTLTI